MGNEVTQIRQRQQTARIVQTGKREWDPFAHPRHHAGKVSLHPFPVNKRRTNDGYRHTTLFRECHQPLLRLILRASIGIFWRTLHILIKWLAWLGLLAIHFDRANKDEALHPCLSSLPSKREGALSIHRSKSRQGICRGI
ncbi:hypothetical protein D3C85_928160 [compost metagenome]